MHVGEFGLLWRLVLALVLSSVVGAEREMRHKSAGLRTYALVGTGSALFMLVSTYGFADVLEPHVTLDPSRVAAQIVSGIGFIGGGLIFVHRESVRGLTTAAGVWATAGIGMAAGGDLPILATGMTVIYLLVSYLYPAITRKLPQSRWTPSPLTLTYRDGQGVLRELLCKCSDHGFSVADVQVEHPDYGRGNGHRSVTVRLAVIGPGSIPDLASELSDVDGVLEVSGADARIAGEP